MFNLEPESSSLVLGSPDPIKAGISGMEDGTRSLSNLEFAAESAIEQLMPAVEEESELLLASHGLGAASLDKPPEVGKDLLTGETDDATTEEIDTLTGGGSDRSKIETRARQRDFAGNSWGKVYNVGELTETEVFGDAVSKSDRRDLYKFRVKEKTDLAIALNELDGNADLFLLNNKGKVLEKSVKGGKQAETISLELEPGVYYGEVRSRGSATANYQITFEGEPTEALPGAGLQARSSNGTNWDASSIGNLTGGAYYKSESVRVDKQDWYDFTLKKRSDVEIELSGLSGNADLHLYDYKKNKWIESSKNPGSSSEAISYALKSGNYAVAVWATDSWIDIDYDLEIKATPRLNNAGTLRGSKPFQGHVSKSDRLDYYQFTLDESKEVDISLSGLNDNADLYLAKKSGKKLKTIAKSKSSGSSDEGVSYPLGKGNYIVVVKAASPSDNTDYDLVISERPLQSVGVLTGTEPFRGSVDKRDPYDFYVFNLEENTDVSINLSGLNDNADLYLFENTVKKKGLVDSSTKSGSSSEVINQNLSAGTYIAVVQSKGGAYTDYNLNLEPNVTTRTDSSPGIPYVFGSLGTQDDTLWEIAQRELKNGNRWGEIMKEDGSTYTDEEARYIKAGTIVYLPTDGLDSEQSGGIGMRTITEEDYQAIAARLNIEVAAIKAVQEVESSGGGFLKSGRPTILFEAHQFSRFTGGRYDRDYPSISSPYPESRQYYKGGEAEHDRIEVAMKLDREAALKSASWGAFQIMGFNYKVVGFNNVEDFVNAMKRSATDQFNAFISFIEFNNLAQYIRNKDWAGFARRYNGPDYKSNRYDERLRIAYEKYSA